MNERLTLAIVLFFVLGSVVVSGFELLSYTFKAVFYTIAMMVLAFILLRYLLTYKKD